MSNPSENSPDRLSSDNIGVLIVELDGDQLQHGMDPESRLALQRMAEAYLEKLRVHHPAEYEAIMKSSKQPS